MKKFLAILILIFTLQTPSQADDIRDFQIEGISVGDNLLDYYSEEEIKNIKKHYYPKSKKLVGVTSNVFSENLKVFEKLQFGIDPITNEIYSVDGKILKFKNNITKCYNEMEKIFKEIILLFPDSKIKKQKERNHPYDKSGKSKTKSYYIYLNNGLIQVRCTDWANNIGTPDSLIVTISSQDWRNFLNKEAYK